MLNSISVNFGNGNGVNLAKAFGNGNGKTLNFNPKTKKRGQ